MPPGRHQPGSSATEAALLLAMATCPVLVIPFASNPFEPHKAAFLWVMAAAACAPVVGAPAFAWRRLRALDAGRRLILLGLACAVAVLCLSAARSEGASLAWWGSTLRRYGALTQVSLLAMLGVTLLAGNGRAASDRLITALILGSVGPTVYGLAQALQIDPLTWAPGRSQGNSTFGNWLFFAGYLATVWPLTVGRAVIATRRALRDHWSRTSSVSAAAVWTLLVLQSAALLSAGSRGPLLALVTASAGAGIVTLMLRGRRAAGVLLAGLAFSAVVAFLVIAPPRMAAVTAGAVDVTSMPIPARSVTVRLILWDAIGTGLRADLAARTGRAILGSGPESTTRMVTMYARPGLDRLLAASNLVPDRAHNDTLDTLATTGTAGLLLELAIGGAALGIVLAGLGLLDRSQTRTFACVACAIVCGVSALAVWRGHGLGALAVAPPAALMLIVSGWTACRRATATPRDPEVAILLVAASAAAVAHFIDLQLSVATVGSALVGAVALAVALGLATGASEPAAMTDESPPGMPAPWPDGAAALLIGWSAAVLTIGLAGPDMQPGLPAVAIVSFAGALSIAVAGADRRSIAMSVLTWIVVSGGWLLFQRSADAFTALLLVQALALACLMAVTAVLTGSQSWRRGVSGTVAALVAGGLVAVVVVRVTAADVYGGRATLCAQQGDDGCVSTQLRNGLALDPMNDQLLTQWAQTLIAKSETSADAAVSDATLAAAERALTRAQAFDPFNYQHPRNLAALHRRWARRSPGTRATHLADADHFYRVATELAPTQGALWAEWANLDAERLRVGDALAKLERAASLGAVAEASKVADALRH